MRATICYPTHNSNVAYSVTTWENRDIAVTVTSVTEITHVLGLKVISSEIHSDLNIVVWDIVLFDVSYRRQFFKITLVLCSA